METIKKASGNQLNNDLINQVLESTEAKEVQTATITPPSDTLVNLPAGFITASGEVIKTAEVRELNGKDEEAIAKAGNRGKIFATILSRGVVSIGSEKVTDDLLDTLLAGDRDALMLGIFRATFGSTAEIPSFCNGCGDFKSVEVDVDRDVNVKILVDSIEDRTFIVQGRKHEFLVTLPNGYVQRELTSSMDKTAAELTTILLENCVLEIDGQPIIGKAQVQNLGVMDRQAISTEISKRLPGPQFADIVLDCPDCGGEVVVPFNLGTLFRV